MWVCLSGGDGHRTVAAQRTEREHTRNDTRNTSRVVACLRRLFTGLSLRRPKFDPLLVRVGFVVDREALQRNFLRVLQRSRGP